MLRRIYWSRGHISFLAGLCYRRQENEEKRVATRGVLLALRSWLAYNNPTGDDVRPGCFVGYYVQGRWKGGGVNSE